MRIYSKISGKPLTFRRTSVLTVFIWAISNFSAGAQEKAPSEVIPSVFSNSLFILLISLATLLLMVIVVFAKMLVAAAASKNEKEKNTGNSSSSGIKALLILLFAGGLSNSLSAQSEATTTAIHAGAGYWGLDSLTFFSLLTIISFELFIAWLLYDLSMELLGVKDRLKKEAEEKEKIIVNEPSFFEKLNASVAVEQEKDIMFDHDYDGIKELDNNLPPWWVWGFFTTVIFAFIYLFHYQVLRTGQSPNEEYEEQIAKGKADVEVYRMKAANLVDENNATLLTDKASLQSGGTIYIESCAPCHGKSGEGNVGPNLTDDYWLHKGGIKDVFRSIKLGWPEKGMKSWEQDLGAKQIHEVASYIKSLRGTNPPNAKEKQGELYTEIAVTDTIQALAKDTIQLSKKDTIKATEKK